MRLILCICFLWLLSGCGTGPKHRLVNLKVEWTEAGLSGYRIMRFQQDGPVLYAGTNKGLYKKDFSKESSNWQGLGLSNDTINDMVIFDSNKILVGVDEPYFNSGQTTLYLTIDGGDTWKAYLNGFGGTKKETWLKRLEHDPTNPDILYAAGSAVVAKSTDQGLSWKPVVASWDAVGGGNFVLRTDPQKPGKVWVGGGNAVFQPILFKSTDYGDTWRSLLKNVSADGEETTIYDLVVNPSNSDRLLIGEGIGIKRSVDDGEHWSKVFSQTPIYALANDPVKQTWVYASGANQDTTLFFAASPDFGDTWQMVTDTTGPKGITINDLVATIVNGKKTLFFSTNKGVYMYEFTE